MDPAAKGMFAVLQVSSDQFGPVWTVLAAQMGKERLSLDGMDGSR